MNRCACPNPSLSNKARLQPATRFHHPLTHLIQNPHVISQKFLNLDLFNQGESTCKLINLNIFLQDSSYFISSSCFLKIWELIDLPTLISISINSSAFCCGSTVSPQRNWPQQKPQGSQNRNLQVVARQCGKFIHFFIICSFPDSGDINWWLIFLVGSFNPSKKEESNCIVSQNKAKTSKKIEPLHKYCNIICTTVDGSEIPNNHLGCMKPVVNNGINYQPQLVNAGFLNHQQHVCIFLSGSLLDFPQKSGQASKAQVQRGRYQISACQNLSTWWIKFAIPGIQDEIWMPKKLT